MAAIFDPSDPASPLAYTAQQTALLLCDFQNLTVHFCGEEGKAALARAQKLRDWALEKDIFVLHSIIDGSREPRTMAKGRERMASVLSMIKGDQSFAEEATGIAADSANIASGKEAVVFKQLGSISGLKADGALSALHERGIKSLLVCGLSTSGAVLRAALGGADEGFVMTAVKDACADRKEGVHEACVDEVMPMSVHVCTVEELVREWK